MSAAQTLIEDFALRDNAPAPRGKLAAIIVLAALGDILLFGEAPGIAGVLFAVAVEIAAVLAARASARKAAISALVGVATLAYRGCECPVSGHRGIRGGGDRPYRQ
jgi:hypothetical protein